MAAAGATARLWVLACIATVVTATLEDGLPRPANLPDAPTTIYDRHPELAADSGAAADCSWYGFSSSLFPKPTTSECQTTLRAALTNGTANPATGLHPFIYYTLVSLADPATNAFFCYQGCFKLDSSLLLPPPPASAPGAFLRGPAMAPVYFQEGPAMAPGVETPGGAPAAQPGN